MKLRKTHGLSAKVLQRKSAKKEKTINSLIVVIYCLAIVCVLLWGQYNKKYEALAKKANAEAEIEKSRIQAMTTAPTWSEFKLVAPEELHINMHENVGRINPNGIPMFLIINGDQWELVEVDHFTDIKTEKVGHILAETYCDQNLIAYIPSIYTSVLRNNLWHEVMHAGACTHGGDEYWNSINPTQFVHPGVKHLGEFLGDFTHNNPQFMNWMANR